MSFSKGVDDFNWNWVFLFLCATSMKSCDVYTLWYVCTVLIITTINVHMTAFLFSMYLLLPSFAASADLGGGQIFAASATPLCDVGKISLAPPYTNPESSPSSGSRNIGEGGHETWNISCRIWLPSFYDYFLQARGWAMVPLGKLILTCPSGHILRH